MKTTTKKTNKTDKTDISLFVIPQVWVRVKVLIPSATLAHLESQGGYIMSKLGIDVYFYAKDTRHPGGWRDNDLVATQEPMREVEITVEDAQWDIITEAAAKRQVSPAAFVRASLIARSRQIRDYDRIEARKASA